MLKNVKKKNWKNDERKIKTLKNWPEKIQKFQKMTEEKNQNTKKIQNSSKNI